MGNLYDKYEKPERMGNNPYTRQGERYTKDAELERFPGPACLRRRW